MREAPKAPMATPPRRGSSPRMPKSSRVCATLAFAEREVKLVLAELRADDELRGATAERLLREALCTS
jgi:hypothetical protein